MPVDRFGTAYQLSGPKDAPVVALIHGIGVNRFLWRDIESALAESYLVLSYDLLGHGESSRAQEPLSLRLFAEQLKNLLDDLEIEKCIAIGFSMGGMINRRFAMDYPDRCAGLVIMNSPHERSPEAQQLVEERVKNTAVGGPTSTLQTSLERWFTRDYLVDQKAVVQQVSNWIINNDTRSYTESRQILASGVTELINPKPPITNPTLVLTCENDSGSTPDMAHGIAGEIEKAEVHIVPHLQHLGMLEKPEMFIKPIQSFLYRTTLKN